MEQVQSDIDGIKQQAVQDSQSLSHLLKQFNDLDLKLLQQRHHVRSLVSALDNATVASKSIELSVDRSIQHIKQLTKDYEAFWSGLNQFQVLVQLQRAAATTNLSQENALRDSSEKQRLLRTQYSQQIETISKQFANLKTQFEQVQTECDTLTNSTHSRQQSPSSHHANLHLSHSFTSSSGTDNTNNQQSAACTNLLHFFSVLRSKGIISHPQQGTLKELLMDAVGSRSDRSSSHNANDIGSTGTFESDYDEVGSDSD